VFVVADNFLELALSGGLRTVTSSSDDPSAAGCVADRELSDPSLPSVVPEQAAVAFTASLGHQAAFASRSSSAMYSVIADAGISLARPWVTDRRRPERICS